MHPFIVIMFIARCVVSIVATAGAIYLASISKDGWGWLVFLAILAAPSMTFSEEKKRTEP
jgi:hypothetical protein